MSLDGVGVFVKAEDGIRCGHVTGVQTSALPILHQAPGGAGHTGTRFENDGGRTRPTNPIVQSAAVVQGRVPCRTVGVAGRSEERHVGKEGGSRGSASERKQTEVET